MHASRVTIAILFFLLAGFSIRGTTAGPDLTDLAWLAGNWTGTQDGLDMEELWLVPKGNTMLGVHRDVKGARTVSFEFLRIEAKADVITYWASPGGRPPTPFRMIELRGKSVVFANAEHDFPNRIIYWLDAKRSLHARIEGTQGGKPAAEEWTWRRSN